MRRARTRRTGRMAWHSSEPARALATVYLLAPLQVACDHLIEGIASNDGQWQASSISSGVDGKADAKEAKQMPEAKKMPKKTKNISQ